MPIYEYKCQGCDHRFEIKQGFNDPPLTTCERCGGAVTKLISAPAIMFKGSGWYITDYSDKLKPPTAGSDQAPKDGKPSKDGDGKGDQAAKKEAPAPAGTTAGTGGATPPKTSGSEGSSSGSSPSPSGTSSSGSSSSSSP